MSRLPRGPVGDPRAPARDRRRVRRSARIGGALAAAIGLGWLGPPAAAAQNADPTTEQVTERTRSFLALWDLLRTRAAGLRIRADQDLISTGEFDGAQLAWLRTAFSVEAGTPVTDSLSVAFSPAFAWEHLIVEGGEDFVVSQQQRDTRLTDFYESSFRLGASYRIDESWGLELVGAYSARHESGADYTDAGQAGGSLAVTYRRGNWLRLRLGLGLGSDIADSELRFSPVFRIQIKPHPRWTIESSGLGATVEWETTRRLTLAFGGHVDGTQYRLDRRGSPPAGSGDATLQRRQARVDLDLTYRFHDKLRLRTGLGLVLDEELSLLDEDGFDVDSRHNRDPSVIVGVGLVFRL